MARTFSGRRLRETRLAAGISVEALAIQIGRTADSVHVYERGRARPPVNIAAHIADSLACRLDDLFDEEVSDAAA